MRATIKDIAARAGTSTATVSMVLNGKDDRISQGTRARVLDIAKELQYRPNQAAINLKVNRSGTLGLIVCDIRNDYYASIARGLEERARRCGMSVLLCNSGDSYDRETEYIEILDSKGVDGIVLGMSSTGSAQKAARTVELLTRRDIPFVLLDRTMTGPRCNAVAMDDEAGGRLAAEHLLALGHTRIAAITGPSYLSGSSLRLSGFRQALRANGVLLDETRIANSDYSYDGGADACRALLKKGGFTALFAFNDMMALGACGALKGAGLSVPGDISVLGYDDIFPGRIADVPLSTVRQPTFEMGERAAQILCNLCAGNAQQPTVAVFPPTLVARASTARLR
ncbi:MAG: LacI family DNA-binding transcriptional regulator [Oscillospiraceae bacterium]|nr:LacI family DNA-binding transcriptional regulator [Oscillospiraceae bacterium]